MDGKSVRGARRTDGTQVHLLAARTGTGLVTAQREVDATTNEITVFQPLLAPLNLHGTVVTFDALHSQTAHARFLVEDKHAHYIALIKGSQPTLHQWLKALPWRAVPLLDKTRATTHGRDEIRRIKAAAVAGIAFPHAVQAVQIMRRPGTAPGCSSRAPCVGTRRRVAAQQARASSGSDVDACQVPVVVRKQPRVHDPAPQGREPCEHDHRGVPGRQPGCVVEVSECLVTAQRVGVVVGVTLQLEQEEIAHGVVAVPTVPWSYTDEASVGSALAQQAVVLEVVDALQEAESEHCLADETWQHAETEGRYKGGKEAERSEPRCQHLVVRTDESSPASLKAPGLKPPGGDQRSHHGTGQEPPEAFPMRELAGSSGVATRMW